MFNIKNKEFLFETVPIRNTVWYYRQSMPEFVWSDSSLENNPFSFVEVKTLGGHKLSDMQQILNLKRANELPDKAVKPRPLGRGYKALNVPQLQHKSGQTC